MRKNTDYSFISSPFQAIIAKIIITISDKKERYEISKRVLITPSTAEKELDKATISKILNTDIVDGSKDLSRPIPKKYYGYLLDEDFKEKFFDNLLTVLDDANESKVSEIVRFVQDGKYTTILNDGDNSAFIVEALREKLEEELDRIKLAVSFHSTNLQQQPLFVGRQDELFEICQSLNCYGYAILSGEPGIGKTEIALRYANECIKYHNIVLWVKFRISFEETFKDIFRNDPRNAKYADIPNAYNIIVSNLNHLGQKVLVVIDGMDVDFIGINYMDELHKYKFRLIITTRSRVNSSIIVPPLNYKYLIFIHSVIKRVNIAYYRADSNPNGFENPFIYSINLLKRNSATSEYEFPYINDYYLGKQMLSYKAWLNKCYNFKSLSADLLHALKFLSTFEMTHYQFCEISGWCSHCTQENINKLFSLGWLNNDENGYYNSFEWWKCFENIDASEFSEEVSRIIKSFSNDSVRGFASSNSLYLYAFAAKNISDGSAEWFEFRNDIANQIRPKNPSLAYEIKRKSGSGLNCLLDYVVEHNKNYKDSSEVRNRNLLYYLDFAVDDTKLESKKLFTKKHLCDKLFNDIVLVERWSIQYIYSFLIDQHDNADHFEQWIRKIVESYQSSETLAGSFTCNIHSLDKLTKDIDVIKEPERNPIYKTVEKYCSVNRIAFPANKMSELIAEWKRIIPMVRLIVAIHHVHHTVTNPFEVNKEDIALDTLRTLVKDYGKYKNSRNQILFYDMIAIIYINRGIPKSAEDVLTKAQELSEKSNDTEEQNWHQFISKLLHSKINIYRFIKKPNDADNISNLREKLNEETKAFDDLNEYLQKLGKFLLYFYCSCLLEKRPDYINYSWIGLECITVLIEIAGAGAGNMPLVNTSLMPDNK